MLADNYIKNWADVVHHVVAAYPAEAGGVVLAHNNEFVPVENTFTDVDTTDKVKSAKFNYKMAEELSYPANGNVLYKGKKVRCILHSHTYEFSTTGIDPRSPTPIDMQAQLADGVEYAIVHTEGENCSPPVFWGDPAHRPPLMQREFIENIQDCLSFTTDWMYQNFNLEMPNFPREFDWDTKGLNLIANQFKNYGFVEVTDEVARGDVFLYRIRNKYINHMGVALDSESVAHHMPRRMPQTESIKVWGNHVHMRVRHKSSPAFKGVAL